MFQVCKPLIVFGSLLIFLLFRQVDQQLFTIHGYAQGTDYTVKYFATDSVVSQYQIDSILSGIDSSMSLYKSYSAINRFNASELGIRIDPGFAYVIEQALKISKATNGKFDVTVKPLVEAWGFGAKRIKGFPDSATVNALLECVGTQNLTLEDRFLRKKKPCVQVDLNGIAQGYSVDVVSAYLVKKRIRSFVVEIGGELRVKGTKPDGKLFNIGVEGPADAGGSEPAIKHVIAIRSGAVTTSGNYRKFIQQGSKKIAHLIDPFTGYPLKGTMISVTVYAKDAITADGYDNALMAMSVEEALTFINARKHMDAYFIYHRNDGSIADTLTTGFKKMIIGR